MTLKVSDYVDILVQREEREILLDGLDIPETAYFLDHDSDCLIEMPFDIIARIGVSSQAQVADTMMGGVYSSIYSVIPSGLSTFLTVTLPFSSITS